MIEFALRTTGRQIDLDSTLDCGQTFRWSKDGEWWKGVVRDTVLFLKENSDGIIVRSSSESLLGRDVYSGIESYLGLEDDLQMIHSTLEKRLRAFDLKVRAVSEKALSEASGLRILRQDSFEMVVEYILSTRNSIPMIRWMSDRLSELFPENRIDFCGESYYAFPSLSQLKNISEETLINLKIGFRVPWLLKLFSKIEKESYFSGLSTLTVEEKLEELTKHDGIGYKVGSCVILFSYGELSAFPVDIWISRVMKDLFAFSGSTKKLMRFGMDSFSPYGGYYQEALFRYYRTHKLGRDFK